MKKYLPALFVSNLILMTPSPSLGVDGGSELVSKFQNAEIKPPRGLSPSQKANNVIRKMAREKGLKEGWDAKKNRIIVIRTAGDKIDSYDPDFLEKRESIAIEVSLKAKAAIIETFSTEASAENILNVPGNPIAKQLEKEEKKLKNMEKRAQRLLDQAKNETAALEEAYDQVRADELKGVTRSDRLNALIVSAVKRLDENFKSEDISEEKKGRLEDIKARLEQANQIEIEKAALDANIKEKIADLQGEIKKETRSVIETSSSMPLFGAITLMQVESYDDLRGQYNLASLLVWSPKLEEEARNILLRKGKGKPRENKLTLDGWLDKQNLGSMVGSRRYLAKDGSTNFLGISAVEFDPDDSGSYSMLQEEVILWAKQAAILSLKASVESVKSAERLKRDFRGKDGETESKILKDFSLNIKESVEGLTIRGLETVRVEEMIHEPTGKNIIVAVANVNSILAVQASELMKDAYALLKEVGADQSFLKGEEAGMKAAAKKTENNMQIYEQGFKSGETKVNNEYKSRQEVTQKSYDPNRDVENKVGPGDRVKDAQSGVWTSDYDVDDDF